MRDGPWRISERRHRPACCGLEGRAPLSKYRVWLALAFLIAAVPSHATTIVGPWIPKFKGVDHSISTNIPSGGDFPNRQVLHALRVDLTDPDIRLLTTPRISNYVANNREVGGLTVSGFLKTNRLQAAINANFFDQPNTGGRTPYYLPAGTPMDVYGLSVSTGAVVSVQDEPGHAAAIVFDSNNRPTVIHTNWPAKSVFEVYTAVAGNYPLVVAGKNIIPRASAREVDPRTAFGVSQDGRYLYLVGIDGRQPGYSDGSNDYETAGWLLLLGAYDGVNLDGGGSTTVVIEDSTGAPIRLNKPSAVADSTRERTVGSHFGVYAKPLPGFINDVLAVPEDTTATITWTTLRPSTTEIEYGLTSSLGNRSPTQSELVINHVVQLAGLRPKTAYYYRVVSSVGSQQFVSSNFILFTTNYTTTFFEITNSWKYTAGPLDGTDWKSVTYDDSSWSGPGPGLLWVDARATGPNPAVEPKNTEMPADPNNSGFPYVTYYFRTHFAVPSLVQGSSLAFSGYIDDGAVFYLNGTEIYRLRIPEAANANTLASGYPCEGDATCLDEFSVPAELMKNLTTGDNVLAVEVHNYNFRSADITFGVSLNRIEPITRTTKLGISRSSESIILNWEGNGFVLQSANSLEGPWTDAGEAAVSPFKVEVLQSSRFYRLRK